MYRYSTTAKKDIFLFFYFSHFYLRFRVPDALLPLKLEGVNLTIDIQAEDRSVEFATVVDGKLNSLQKVDSPREKFNFEIVEAKALELNSKNEWVLRSRSIVLWTRPTWLPGESTTSKLK